jgi:anion-transporting  ArsA/GET3 family ATPase
MSETTQTKSGQAFDPDKAMKALDKADIKKLVAKAKADSKADNKKLTIKDILTSKKGQDFFLECEVEKIKLADARKAFSDLIGYDVPQKTLRRVLNELGLYQPKEKSDEAASQQSKGEKESNEQGEVDHGEELVEQTDSTSGETDFNIDVQVGDLPDSFAPAQHSSHNDEDEDIYK